MMIPYVRLLTLINDASDSYPETTGSPDPGIRPWNEGRALIDGALVVYDLDDPPAWLVPVLAARDEDGNTEIGVVTTGPGVNAMAAAENVAELMHDRHST